MGRWWPFHGQDGVSFLSRDRPTVSSPSHSLPQIRLQLHIDVYLLTSAAISTRSLFTLCSVKLFDFPRRRAALHVSLSSSPHPAADGRLILSRANLIVPLIPETSVCHSSGQRQHHERGDPPTVRL